MNKQIPKRSNRPRAFLPALFLVLIVCSPVRAQRGPLPFPLNAPQLPGQPPGQMAQNPMILNMRVAEGQVTADIVDCPLQKALQELADRTGIIFELRSHDTPMVSVHLKKVTLEEAIQRITPGHNVLFYYDRDKAEERITKVRIFPRGGAIQQPAIVYLGSGAVTKTNDDVDTPEQAIKALAENARLEMKEKAIGILVRNKSEAATKALINSLLDPAPEIRAAAIEGLVAFEARDALPGILKGLKDTHPGVRQSAITAVALMGDSKNVQDLKPLSTDKDASVASAADSAIKKLSAGARK
jgi:hypothetical protein